MEDVKATTNDGYELTMAHITSDEEGNLATKGPLLLLHDQKRDGRSFFTYYDTFSDPLTQRLFDDGWDLWIANTRGTKYSRTHTSLDADGADEATGAKAYWNFDTTTVAAQDVPAMINKILETRQTAGQDCLKVHILDSSWTSLSTAAQLPTTSSDAIAQILTQNPCLINN